MSSSSLPPIRSISSDVIPPVSTATSANMHPAHDVPPIRTTGQALFQSLQSLFSRIPVQISSSTMFASRVNETSLIPSVGRVNQVVHANQVVKEKPMLVEEALALLNVPLDRADDIAFIDGQYKTAMEKATPKKELGPSSPMYAMINQLLQDIEKAYALLKASHIEKKVEVSAQISSGTTSAPRARETSMIPSAGRIGQVIDANQAMAEKPMLVEEALALLNIPPDRVNDIKFIEGRANDVEFIEAQYKKARQKSTPKKELGPSSLMYAWINQRLQDVEKAYALLKASHVEKKAESEIGKE